MAAAIFDMRTYQRIRQEDPDQRWVREKVSEELARCRLSLVQISNAVAEAKRRLGMHWPKESAAAHAVRAALVPEPPEAA